MMEHIDYKSYYLQREQERPATAPLRFLPWEAPFLQVRARVGRHDDIKELLYVGVANKEQRTRTRSDRV